jgi:hypothetical protein
MVHRNAILEASGTRLTTDLVKGHAAETWRVERAGDRASLDQRERRVAAADGRQGVMLGVRASRPRIVQRQIVEPQIIPAHAQHGRTIFRATQV